MATGQQERSICKLSYLSFGFVGGGLYGQTGFLYNNNIAPQLSGGRPGKYAEEMLTCKHINIV